MSEPYAIEVWIEKSTMADVLVPLARRLGFTLVTGVGDLSHTHCNWLVQRVLEHRRKTRVLYLSDFGPGGVDAIESFIGRPHEPEAVEIIH